jgi:tetratricopeptide (TPR) repeat protein
MPTPRFGFITRVLLYILLGISLAMVITAGAFWWQLPANQPTRVTATAENLKEKLEAYDKRADELEKLVTLLLGVSTIYAVALSLSAYQQLKDSADKLESLKKDAEKEIDRLPDDIAKIRNEAKADMRDFVVKVESKFPLFADMDIAIRTVMDELISLLPVIDWSDADYRRLSDQERQKIFFYEKTVASLEYFDLRSTRDMRQTTSEIYHGLGNYYGLKYVSDGKVHTEDREKSRFYLDRAIRHDRQNTGALNDRAFLALYLDAPPKYADAKQLFSKSLEADSEQQRARYNLAYLEHSDKNYRRAGQLLTEALSMKRWQNKLPARNRNDILYNRGCAYARLGEPEEALKDLEEVFSVRGDYTEELVKQFKQDIQSNGDLFSLASTTPWDSRIAALRSRLP